MATADLQYAFHAGILQSPVDPHPRGRTPPVLYVPVAQMSDALTHLGNSVIPLSWIVKTTTSTAGLTAMIQKEFLAVDAQLPVSRVRAMEDVVAHSIAQQNFNMLLLTIFGAIALALAAIGIYLPARRATRVDPIIALRQE